MTELPILHGSGLKGAWREVFRSHTQRLAAEKQRQARDEELKFFGPAVEGEGAGDAGTDAAIGGREAGVGAATTASAHFAGAVQFGDARLLLLPIRSAHGGWAWATCPLQLQRLQRDIQILTAGRGKVSASFDAAKLRPSDNSKVLVAPQSGAAGRSQLLMGKEAVILEDAFYLAEPNAEVELLGKWLESVVPSGAKEICKGMAGQLAVLANEEFFALSRQATEVATRVRIDPDTGTVADGALWTEESLPAESVLWSSTVVSRDRRPNIAKPDDAESMGRDFKKLLDERQAHPLFLGGDRTTGRGMAGVRVVDPASLAPAAGQGVKP